MKKIIILAIFILTSFAYGNDVLEKSKALPFEYLGLSSVTILINETAATDDNDTLVSAWTYIGDANAVELFHSVDDTVDIRWYIDYAVGSDRGTYYSTTAIDSIKSTGTASTQVSVGKVLRNFSATNLIPGANYVRLRAYFQTASEASGAYKAWLNIRN